MEPYFSTFVLNVIDDPSLPSSSYPISSHLTGQPSCLCSHPSHPTILVGTTLGEIGALHTPL